MIGLKIRTEGVAGLGVELLKETRRDALSPVARAADKLERRMKEKLSVRGGPSRPGDPPALEQGALQDSIGRTGPYSDPGTVSAAVGVGVGREATQRVDEWKRRGVNVFEYAHLHENGGQVAGVRFPPRSFVRSTFAELEAEIVADWERSL